MKKLHLVGFTKDIDGLILSPRKGAKSGGFVVALDDELVASLDQARRRREFGDDLPEDPGEPVRDNLPVRRTRPNSALSPREIQARLRAGSTIAEVAGQAGVDEDWVRRFADPILAEQARVVESAQKLTFAKARLGPSIEPLAPSVQWNLTDRGVRFSDDVFTAGWSAFNLHGARWAVRFSFANRQRRQVAEWEVDLREQTLSARNRIASDLGHVEAGRRRPRLEPVEHPNGGAESTAPAPVEARAGARSPARKAAGRRAPGAGKAGPAPKAAVKTGPRPAPGAGAGRAASGPVGVRAATGKGAAKAPTAARGKGAVKAPTAAKGKGAAQAAAGRGAAQVATGGRGKGAAAKAAGGGKAAATGRPGAAAERAAGAAPARSAVTRAARQSSPRKARPAKKPAPESPTAGAPAEPVPERPSHLARPPSPMNMANRASSLPGRRLGSPYSPPPRSLPPRPAPPTRTSSPPRPAAPPAGGDRPPRPATTSPPPAEMPEPPAAAPAPPSAPTAPAAPAVETSVPAPAGTRAPPPGRGQFAPAPPPERGPGRPQSPAAARAGVARATPARKTPPRPAVMAPPLPRPAEVGEPGEDRPAVVILSSPPTAPGPARATPAGSRGRDGGTGRLPGAGAAKVGARRAGEAAADQARSGARRPGSG